MGSKGGLVDIYEKGTAAVLNYDVDSAREWANDIVKRNIDPAEAIEKSLVKGVRIVGDMFGRKEIFLPEMMMAAEVMKVGLEVLLPKIRKTDKEWKSMGRVVIGTVLGDIHDIGKNIVIAMLIGAGFEVYDLGIDVPAEKFVEKVKELEPEILGMSALLSTTARYLKTVIDALKKEGLRDKVKVMVGGRGVTRQWADEMGADTYCSDWKEAVEKAKKLVGVRK